MIRKFALLALIALILVLPVSATDYGFYNLSAKPDLWLLPNTEYTMTQTYTAATAESTCLGLDPTYTGTEGAEILLYNTGYLWPNGTVTGYSSPTSYCTNNFTGTCSVTFNTSTKKYASHNLVCRKGTNQYLYYYPVWQVDLYNLVDKEVNFTGTPVTGSAPLTVSFTATNITNTTGLSWSFGDGQMVNSPSSEINHTYQNPGIYTVRMDYTNLSGFPKSIQKNNYITVGAPNATATTHAVARDLYTGFAINGAQVDMYDVENTSWTNTTTTNGIGSITTLLGHKINIWGSAVGYEDDNLQDVPSVDGGYYSLLLKPSNLTIYNTTPGNLTLIVTVQDLQLPHPTIQGAEVTAAWGSQYASGTTNAAGNTFFTVPNNTAIHLSAFKSGYASGSSTHITGSANGGPTTETAIMYIGTDYVTPVPTVTLTTGPGGTIPQTVDPYPCVGDGSPEDTANCQRKQSSMAADLISYGPDLVQFFIMLTFIGGLLLITKR